MTPRLQRLYTSPSGLSSLDGDLVRVTCGLPDTDGGLWEPNSPFRLAPWLSDQHRADAFAEVEAAFEAGLLASEHAEILAESIMAASALDLDPREPTPVPMPDWARMFREPGRFYACAGGRGSAKSRSVALEILLSMVERPERVLATREYQAALAASAHRAFSDLIEKLNLSGFFEVTRDRIAADNGGEILFAGLATDPQRIKSMENLTTSFAEESSSMSRLGLETLLPTMRARGARLFFVWNSAERSDPVEIFAGDKAPPATVYRHTTYRDNAFFSIDQLPVVESDRRRDPDRHSHVWLGQHRQLSEARVFHRIEIADFSEEVERVQAAPRYACDWGFIDPTAAVEVFILDPATPHGKPRFYIARERYRSKVDIDDLPALLAGSDPIGNAQGEPRWQNRAGWEPLLRDPRYRVIADSARADLCEFLKKKGLRVDRSVKGKGSIAAGIERLKGYDIVIHPDCVHAIEEFSKYSYQTDSKTGEILPEFEDKWNHIIDACRYLVDGIIRKKFTSKRLQPLDRDAQTQSGLGADFGPKLVDGGGSYYSSNPILRSPRISKGWPR